MLQLKKATSIVGTICLICQAFLTINPAAANSETHERAIAEAYRDWVEATNAKDIEKWASFLAPDAIFLPPNNPALNNEVKIREFYIRLFTDERFRLDCRQNHVEISQSEDLAWSMGYCSATFTGQNGEEAQDKSKWAKVWKRLPSGEWKCIVNSWSSALVR